MNLDQLIAAGAILQNGLVKKSVTWKRRDEKKKIKSDTFDVHVKKLLSAADVEFIYHNIAENEGIMARRVCRLIYLGDDGIQPIPYDLAATMEPTLLMAFCDVLNVVAKENSTPEGEEEKNSQPPMSSGTNLSSTESAEKQ
jgi:hypothetical protein